MTAYGNFRLITFSCDDDSPASNFPKTTIKRCNMHYISTDNHLIIFDIKKTKSKEMNVEPLEF